MSQSASAVIERQVAGYRRLLRLLPEPVRREHAHEMAAIFRDLLIQARGSVRAWAAVWIGALVDLARHGWVLHRTLRSGPGSRLPNESTSMSERMRNALSALGRDALYGVRLLRKDWSFTLTAVLILGLAMGANTAIFSFVDTYLLRPLPYPQPERLALVSRVFPGGALGAGQDGRLWEAVRDGVGEGMRVAVYSDSAPAVNLATGDAAISVPQQRVGAGYFATLGVRPRLGREFTAAEASEGGPPVTILGHRMWQLLFDGDPDAIGETVLLRGEPFTVVGVMPEGFRTSSAAELWVPLATSTTGEGSGVNYTVLMRLEGDTAWAEADARLEAIGRSVLEAGYEGSQFERLSLQPLQQSETQTVREPLQLLWISVAVVLLVACVNVSGLLLVRASRRGREIATRMALGGGRGAVLRQLLTESLVLAALAGAVGIGFAYVMLGGLAEIGRGLLVTWRPVTLDGRVLLVSGALSLATALVFGLAPAVQAGRVSIQDALRAGGGRGSTGAGAWTRRFLVVTEVALSVVLLVMAGLLLRTFLHLKGGDPGFESEGLVAVSVSLADARYQTREQVETLFEEGARRVEELGATVSTAAGLTLPYQRPLNIGFEPLDFEIEREGYTITNLTYVTPGYLETLRMRVLDGRAFDVSDNADSEPVAIVNEAFARTYMPEIAPVGRAIATVDAERRIVGVVADVKAVDGSGLTRGPLTATPMVYVPLGQVEGGFLQAVHGWFAPAWVVRVSGPAVEAVPAIEQALGSVDPLLPLASTRLLDEIHSGALREQRFMATLVSLLGLSSVVLAGLGIFGLVASAVAEQRREIGIRLALGAGAAHAIRVVALPSVAWAAVGAVIGLGGSLLAGRAASSMLWGVEPADPWTYAGVCLALIVAASVASLIPASRAARVDPARSLRTD